MSIGCRERDEEMVSGDTPAGLCITLLGSGEDTDRAKAYLEAQKYRSLIREGVK